MTCASLDFRPTLQTKIKNFYEMSDTKFDHGTFASSIPFDSLFHKYVYRMVKEYYENMSFPPKTNLKVY